ncbi:MAG: response regulator transcription factor [Alphaproteobacteria bacterium]|nr:response regulator transcription factor [Alphaproteobacteria bacterium]
MLADADPGVRQPLKAVLQQNGFRDIIDAANSGVVEEALIRNAVDLVVGDFSLPGADLCHLIHRARHHTVGNNPFVLTIVMTGNPTTEKVRRVVDSGADDLVIKPISPEQVVQRISNLARGRKPFVVTHDYIGPDRRKETRPGVDSAPTVEVPNPLRAKALSTQDAASIQRMIDAAASRINECKMERYAIQVKYLVDRIMPWYETPGDTKDLLAYLDRLRFVGEDLSRRMRGTPYAHVSELTLSLVELVNRMLLDPANPDPKDLELLPKLCQAIGRAFDRGQQTVQAAQEISRSLQAYTTKR